MCEFTWKCSYEFGVITFHCFFFLFRQLGGDQISDVFDQHLHVALSKHLLFIWMDSPCKH